MIVGPVKANTVELQSKMLKVIEEQEVRRLGGMRSEPVDIWVLAATSEDLSVARRERRLQEALYHRLAVVSLWLPPLRTRWRETMNGTASWRPFAVPAGTSPVLQDTWESHGIPCAIASRSMACARALHQPPRLSRPRFWQRGTLQAHRPTCRGSQPRLPSAGSGRASHCYRPPWSCQRRMHLRPPIRAGRWISSWKRLEALAGGSKS